MEGFVALAAHAAAGLVLVAGVGKLTRPAVTGEAFALTRRPAATWLIRLVGAGEVSLSATALTVGGRLPFSLLAVAYVVFVVVAERQRRSGRSCGCFTSSDSTVGPLHLGIDGVAALVSASAAYLAVPGLADVAPASPFAAAAVLALLSLAVVLARLALTALPELLSVRAQVAAGVRQ